MLLTYLYFIRGVFICHGWNDNGEIDVRKQGILGNLCRLNIIVFILLKVNFYSAVVERVKCTTGNWIKFSSTCFVFYLITANGTYYI